MAPSHQPTVEDVSDEGENTVKQANISLKRSKDLIDRQSDSGYSSRTHLTDASADSMKSPKPDTASSVASVSDVHTATSTASHEIVVVDGVKKIVCRDRNCPHRKKNKSTKSKAKSKSKSKPKPTSDSNSNSESPKATNSQPTVPSTRQSSPRRRPSSRSQDQRLDLPKSRQRAASTSSAARTPSYSMHPPPHHRNGNQGPPISMMNRSVHYRLPSGNIAAPQGSYGPPTTLQANFSQQPRYGSPVIKHGQIKSARTPTDLEFMNSDHYDDNKHDDDDESYDDDDADVVIEDNDDYDQDDEDYNHYQKDHDKFLRYGQDHERHVRSLMEAELRDYESKAYRSHQAEKDKRSMPPPKVPFSMRRPQITYDDGNSLSHGGDLNDKIRQLTLNNSRPNIHPLGKNNFPHTQPAIPTRRPSPSQANRRNSYYAGENIEAELARRSYQTPYNVEPNWGHDHHIMPNHTPRHRRESIEDAIPRMMTDHRLRDAQSHIERARSQTSSANSHPLTENSMRVTEAGSSRRSKPSSSKGSSPHRTGRERRRDSNASLSQASSRYVDQDLPRKINPERSYDIDIDGKRLGLVPDGRGQLDLVVISGDQHYHSSRNSNYESNLDRRNSTRSSRYVDGTVILEENLHPGRSRDASNTRRRRAETINTSGSSRSRERGRDRGYIGPRHTTYQI